jgi:hypothetical protein
MCGDTMQASTRSLQHVAEHLIGLVAA